MAARKLNFSHSEAQVISKPGVFRNCTSEAHDLHYRIGLCSVTELDSLVGPAKSSTAAPQSTVSHRASNNGSPQPTFRSLFEVESISSGNSYDPSHDIPLHHSSGVIHNPEEDFSPRLLRGALASSSDRRVSEKPVGHLFSFLRDCMRRTSLGGRCYESKTDRRSIAV